MPFYKNVFVVKSLFVKPMPNRISKPQSGFTLLELMVVVAILVVIAGAAIMSFGNTASDAQHQITRLQLKQLAAAVEAYYQDNQNNPVALTPPGRESPADLAFLFNLKDASAAEWSPDYRQGWRGPYLKQAQVFYVDIGDDLRADGSSLADSDIHGNPGKVDGGELSNLLALPDPYTAEPLANGVFQWQKTFDPDNPLDVDDLTQLGRPYLLIDLAYMNSKKNKTSSGIPRVISLGPNGIYEPRSCDHNQTEKDKPNYCDHDVLCQSAGDDLVLCLR